MADIQELFLILGISATWDLQSHAIEYQDFQSENIPLTGLSHVIAESPRGLADSEIRISIAPDFKSRVVGRIQFAATDLKSGET